MPTSRFLRFAVLLLISWRVTLTRTAGVGQNCFAIIGSGRSNRRCHKLELAQFETLAQQLALRLAESASRRTLRSVQSATIAR